MHLAPLHAHLLSEIDDRTFRPLLQEITLHHGAFAAYPSWGAVADAINNRRLPEKATDALLAPMLTAYGSGVDPRWGAILCACCFRSLVATYHPRRKWHSDAEEVFQEIIGTFLDVCRRVAARPMVANLRRRLANETCHRLHEEFTCRWRSAAVEQITDPHELVPTVDPQQEPDRRNDLLDLTEHRELVLTRLKRHLEAGTISETDYLILVGTRLYGESMAEEGARHGLSREATKKKSQRAEAAIRKAELGGAP
jgi:hypothetical protein